MALLEIDAVDTYYGRVHALQGVSLTVEEGEIVTLIGSNGAGKTTTLRTISGIIRPRRGQVRLAGKRIDNVPAEQMVRLGIGHSPEGRRIFSRMTVQENLEMGAFSRQDKLEIQRDLESVLVLFPRLRERLKRSEEHTSELQSQSNLVCRLLLEKKQIQRRCTIMH